MNEIIFTIEQEDDGGYVASSLKYSIVTQADHLKDLRKNIKEATLLYFENSEEKPKIIRLHYITKDELIEITSATHF